MSNGEAAIHFRLDPRSGVPAYRQIADQVRNAARLGFVRPGDRLPSVREVVAQVRINPNTVLRAYRELEADGMVVTDQGRGTFVAEVSAPLISPARQLELHEELLDWIRRARRSGMGDDAIMALVAVALPAPDRARDPES